MTRIINRAVMKRRRRFLRSRPTRAEAALWHHLKARAICGAKFRRQASIGNYGVDFYCASARLAIEVDGEIHLANDQSAHDDVRAAFLESLGIQVLRFGNDDVLERPDFVIERIRMALQ